MNHAQAQGLWFDKNLSKAHFPASLNPFVPNALFLYPLKTSKNR